MQFSGPIDRAANLGEFDLLLAKYEAVAGQDIQIPQLQLFLKTNEDYLKYGSVNKRVLRLCNSMNAPTPEGTKMLETIKKIVREAGLTRAPIESTGKNVMGVIGSHLKPKELRALSQTSSRMQELTSGPLSREFITMMREKAIIGPKKWELLLAERGTPEINFEGLPPLPDDMDQILASNCPFFEGKKVFETHVLVAIPRGLSLDNMGPLLGHLKEDGEHLGTVFKDGTNTHGWLDEFWHDSFEKPHWVLVPKVVLPGSGDQSFKKQEELLEDKFKDYDTPSALETAAVIGIVKETSGEYLLPKNSYTNCYDTANYERVYVGGFDRFGITVGIEFGSHESFGILPMRRFLSDE